MQDSRSEDIFPASLMEEVYSELSSRTHVVNIQKAARILEKRLLPDEQEVSSLALIYPADDILEAVLINSLSFLIMSYRCPRAKILLARYQDSLMIDSTAKTLEEARFRPVLHKGTSPSPATHSDEAGIEAASRLLLIEDQPYVLELLRMPLDVWQDMTSSCLEDPSKFKKLFEKTKEATGEVPGSYYSPHSEGRLASTIEAIAIHACGFPVGFQLFPGKTMVNLGFRNVTVAGRPPFDNRILKISRDAEVRLFDELKNGT